MLGVEVFGRAIIGAEIDADFAVHFRADDEEVVDLIFRVEGVDE